MLKSHFKLFYDDDDVVEEEQEPEETTPEVDEIPARLLNKSEVGVRLSLMGKTADGDGYTYLKCKITGLKVTHIDVIKRYRHLLFLDVSHNLLDINALQAITQLPYLILIHADDNRLNSAALKQMKYLQVIIFNDNEITAVNDLFQEQMSTIEIGNNKIERIEFDTQMPTLKVLDFRNNLIADISNFKKLSLPNLDSLYLAGNKLKTLVGLEKLVNLRILHVRNNPIRYLNGFNESQTKLQYINLRNCKVATLKQIKKLRVLKGLETLVIKGCPYMGGSGEEEAEKKEEEDDPILRVEVFAALPRLKRINKNSVTPEEREESNEIIRQWAEEGEKDEEEVEEHEVEEQSVVEDVVE